MVANWPYTLAIVMPVNRALKGLSLDDADVDPEQLLRRWSQVHGWRGVLGALAIGFAVAGAL